MYVCLFTGEGFQSICLNIVFCTATLPPFSLFCFVPCIFNTFFPPPPPSNRPLSVPLTGTNKWPWKPCLLLGLLWSLFFVINCLFYKMLRLLTSNENHTKKPGYLVFGRLNLPQKISHIVQCIHCTSLVRKYNIRNLLNTTLTAS